uniref:Reverse transcriptase domain-containing protein n=1 Tax=Amphimedon queenslandica TaxID=400682 RepID=A0A1X7UFN3_AMPQE
MSTRSLENFSTIPSEWKVHRITPVYKSGDKSLVTNYRPISLLCIASKVLERLIYDQLLLILGTLSHSQLIRIVTTIYFMLHYVLPLIQSITKELLYEEVAEGTDQSYHEMQDPLKTQEGPYDRHVTEETLPLVLGTIPFDSHHSLRWEELMIK